MKRTTYCYICGIEEQHTGEFIPSVTGRVGLLCDACRAKLHTATHRLIDKQRLAYVRAGTSKGNEAGLLLDDLIERDNPHAIALAKELMLEV